VALAVTKGQGDSPALCTVKKCPGRCL